MLSDHQLHEMAQRLIDVPGIVGVMLGGSRARDAPIDSSDVDLGLYYRPPLDVDALGVLARELAGPDAEVSARGAWGPWVDGGGWLDVAGTPVDWIYRELDRVDTAWRDARDGRFRFHFQVGHPLGVPDFSYVGEVALGRVLADPSGVLTALRAQAQDYPPELRRRVVTTALSEAEFALTIARKGVGRRDTAYVAGCLFRVVGLCAHALHAHAGAWLINEKGAVDAAAALPGAPLDFAEAAHGVLAGLGRSEIDLRAARHTAGRLIAATSASCGQRFRR
ncbi:nucleotidyltransferase domain-containing protein [Cryptosporangium arvum]|uniref:nucleotidyltransferase domain-containing protein n=1 Tax=Cryptosporangium arvum TaxID=80871 RepID=UPI0004B15C86|nr:nucleotidyltransferase domain-containing protein [Cryptosporangium arvum]